MPIKKLENKVVQAHLERNFIFLFMASGEIQLIEPIGAVWKMAMVGSEFNTPWSKMIFEEGVRSLCSCAVQSLDPVAFQLSANAEKIQSAIDVLWREVLAKYEVTKIANS